MSNGSLLDAVCAEVSSRLKSALKGRDRVSADALRAALSALDNASAQPLSAAQPFPYGSAAEVPRRELSGAEIEALLVTEADAHAAAAVQYERLGHADRADRLRREAEIIRGTLEHVAAADTTPAP